MFKKERGTGQGVGGEPVGDGGASICVCPKCGKEVEHKKGVPCADMTCCGVAMVGKEASVEEQEKALSFWNMVKDFFKKEEKNPHPFMVWKEGEDYRWLAIYSNKWRDNDNPPEILAEAAHKDFVAAVDSGDWPYPEVWLWHIEDAKFGVADFVTYDESGFALASGLVDKDKEHIAESLSQKDDLATSHGMPIEEIQRETEDSTIITRYRTVEISPLPYKAAANKHGTGFEILKSKEVTMGIPENKRPFLEDTMGKEGVAALEEKLEGKAEELKDQGIEFKETEQEEKEEETPEEAPETPEAPEFVSAEDVAQAVGSHLKPLMDQMQGLAEVIASVGKEVEAQGETLKGLQQDDEAKIKAAIADTPAASLFDRIGSVIGTDETAVDGRTSLAKSGPEEVVDHTEGPTPVSILNEYLAQPNYGG